MKIRFLLDECESPRLKTAFLRFNPAIDVLPVGDPDAPHLETLDPEILRYLEEWLNKNVVLSSVLVRFVVPRLLTECPNMATI